MFEKSKKEHEERKSSIVLKIYDGVRALLFGGFVLVGGIGVCSMTPEEKENYNKTVIPRSREEQVEYVLEDEEQSDEIEMVASNGNVARVRMM